MESHRLKGKTLAAAGLGALSLFSACTQKTPEPKKPNIISS